MCYDAGQLKLRGLKREWHYAEGSRKDELWEKYRQAVWEFEKDKPIGEIYHASGYEHPEMLIITSVEPFQFELAHWGLIPHWCKDLESAKKIQNSTINARGETIWEKPSFRDSANRSRCVVPLSYFFEHHHKNGKAYPFRIEYKDHRPMFIAGLSSEWINKETGEVVKTFTIITTKGNDILSVIHNNPKLSEPRMPVILEIDELEDWLQQTDKILAGKLLDPYDKDDLNAESVLKLRGKDSVGNSPEVLERIDYPELAELF